MIWTIVPYLGQSNGIDVPSFPAAFNGALIPAISLALGTAPLSVGKLEHRMLGRTVGRVYVDLRSRGVTLSKVA